MCRAPKSTLPPALVVFLQKSNNILHSCWRKYFTFLFFIFPPGWVSRYVARPHYLPIPLALTDIPGTQETKSVCWVCCWCVGVHLRPRLLHIHPSPPIIHSLGCGSWTVESAFRSQGALTHATNWLYDALGKRLRPTLPVNQTLLCWERNHHRHPQL